MTVETRRQPGMEWLKAQNSGIAINLDSLHAARQTVVDAAQNPSNRTQTRHDVMGALRTIAVFNDLGPRHQEGITAGEIGVWVDREGNLDQRPLKLNGQNGSVKQA